MTPNSNSGMEKTAVIIGAGLGGLFTGAILSKEGIKVTLLEKNTTIGGGLQTFKRFGKTFDTGMHIVGGLNPEGNIRKICKYLGISEQIKVCEVDDDCTDRLYFAEDKSFYSIAKGKEGFVDRLSSHFPEERENLKRYVAAIYHMADQVDLFNLRPSEGVMNLFAHSDDFMMSANGFIAKYVKDDRLRSILAYMNPLYGGIANHTPAYIHAIISVLYMNGTCRFVGGSSLFADLLANVIISNGGRVITQEKVSYIDVKEKKVEYVETSNGHRYQADYYISAIHPCSMLNVITEDAFPKSYRNRLNSIPNAYSAFSVFIKLKPNSFPYINHSEFYMTEYRDVWEFGNAEKKWPLGFLFMTPPEERQGEFASKAIVMAPMPYEMTAAWEDTTVGKRGNDYLEWKQTKTDALLRQVEEIHPNFRNCIENINTASPLTIRDFYGVKEGSICGYSKDCNNIALSQVPVVTKVSNLYLTGQNNNLHGFCGVPLTSINTCEAILGNNYIIEKINKCAKS